MPGLNAEKHVGYMRCLYQCTPDLHMILGRHPEDPSVVFACGFSGSGFQFAPAIASVLTALVDDKVTEQQQVFLKKYDPGRFQLWSWSGALVWLQRPRTGSAGWFWFRPAAELSMWSMVVIGSNFKKITRQWIEEILAFTDFTCFLEGRSLTCIAYFCFFICVSLYSLYPQGLISLLYPSLMRSLSNHPEQDVTIYYRWFCDRWYCILSHTLFAHFQLFYLFLCLYLYAAIFHGGLQPSHGHIQLVVSYSGTPSQSFVDCGLETSYGYLWPMVTRGFCMT